MIARLALEQALAEAKGLLRELAAIDALLATPAGRLPARARLEAVRRRVLEGIRRAEQLKL